MASNSSEGDIKEFWEENPCGENLTGKLEDWAQHFKNYDEFRYSTEGHILHEFNEISFQGRKVLEIGVGQAADSAQIVKRGAEWNGLDLTEAAVRRAKTRFSLEGLEYGEAKVGSALDIPWPNDTFDIIYSHGVLHHIPKIDKVVQEIRRVLKPNGQLVMMLYHKNSLNYYVSILLIRRMLLIPIYILSKLRLGGLVRSKVLRGHIKNADKEGLWGYLKKEKFIHANTDGPENPFSRVYDIERVNKDFAGLRLQKTKIHFLNSRHFPGIKILPKRWLKWLESHYGWHLWVFMVNDKQE